MKEYKILKSTYYDRKGKERSSYFYIKYKVPFLWFWSRWKYVTHQDCGMSGCYNVRTRFSTLKEAQQFAQDYICGGKVWDDFVTKQIEHKVCG